MLLHGPTCVWEPQASESTQVEEAGDPTVPLLLNYDDTQESLGGRCPEEEAESESPALEKPSLAATVTDPMVILFLSLVRLRLQDLAWRLRLSNMVAVLHARLQSWVLRME